jgi:hypothetical protein
METVAPARSRGTNAALRISAKMYDVVGQDQGVQPQCPASYGQNETRLVQQLYRPEAILLGSRKMKTLPRYRLQKELD